MPEQSARGASIGIQNTGRAHANTPVKQNKSHCQVQDNPVLAGFKNIEAGAAGSGLGLAKQKDSPSDEATLCLGKDQVSTCLRAKVA